MAKYHSTMSRRNFMKALGLGAAATVTAGAAAPMFADLDELTASGKEVGRERPWWVKEREFENPTVEHDWDVIYNHDNRWETWEPRMREYLFGPEKMSELLAKGVARAKEASEKKSGGFLTKDWAMSAAAWMEGDYFKWNLLDERWASEKIRVIKYTANPGVPKYDATSPEENAKMLRAAFTYLGASSIGIVPLTGNSKKIMNSYHSKGKKIEFNDAAEHPYETDTHLYIPSNRTFYAVIVGILMSKEIFKHENGEYGSGQLRNTVNYDRYRLWQFLSRALQRFINYLDYDCIGFPGTYGETFISTGGGSILSGMTEQARQKNYFISPEFGACQGYFAIGTDLPLAVDKPIDAGTWKFCQTCQKCSEACPTGAIQGGTETTYEQMDPSLYKHTIYSPENKVNWMVPGKKTFLWDAPACATATMEFSGACCNCMGTCTFNTGTAAGIHELVKPVVSTTSLLNGFFWRADGFFGLDLTKDDKKDEWWDKRLPIHGVDSTILASDWGYRQRGLG